MQIIKWLGLAAAIALIVSCFMPWVVIESKDIVVSGVDSTGTNFGKPGYFHLFIAGLYIVFVLVNRLWSKRVNMFLSAFNVAWAVRNFAIVSACYGGECPDKKAGLYLSLIASVVMIVSVLSTGAKEKKFERE
jgi:hypothetical protein